MKLSKEQELFKDNNIKLNKILYDTTDKELQCILKNQIAFRDEILQNVANIIFDLEVKDDVMNLNSIKIAQLNKKITKEIQVGFNNQITEEDKLLNDLLLKIGEDKYYLNAYNLSLGLDFSLKKISSKELINIIKKTIEGKTYSDRIYDNKNKVAKVLRKEIKDFLEGKTSVNSIKKIIKYRFNVNASDTDRLVVNEANRVLSEVNEVWSKDYNIEYQMFDATLDSKTTALCQSLDGEVFRVDDTNKPIPPEKTHIRCRSCLIAIPSKEWRPKTRIDNESKKQIDYRKYKDWKERKGL